MNVFLFFLFFCVIFFLPCFKINIDFYSHNPEFVFPEPKEEDGGRPKEKWEMFAELECGWGKEFIRSVPRSHKTPEKWPRLNKMPACVDPRGCKDPPYRNDRIWGSWEDSKDKLRDVGTIYWYECRKGWFDFENGTLIPYMELKCVNDETGGGGAPYWDPPYEHDTVDFPKCTLLRKYEKGKGRPKMKRNIHVNTQNLTT